MNDKLIYSIVLIEATKDFSGSEYVDCKLLVTLKLEWLGLNLNIVILCLTSKPSEKHLYFTLRVKFLMG